MGLGPFWTWDEGVGLASFLELETRLARGQMKLRLVPRLGRETRRELVHLQEVKRT